MPMRYESRLVRLGFLGVGVLAGVLATLAVPMVMPRVTLFAQGGRAAQPPITDPVLQRQMALQRFKLIPKEAMSAKGKKDWDDYERYRPGSNPGGMPWNVLMRVPTLAPLLVQLRLHVLSPDSQLPPRLVEWSTIIACRYWTVNHAWNSHSPAAIADGVKPETVKSLGEGRRPVGMAEDEEIIFDLLDELWNHHSITDATYAKANAKLGEGGMIEVVAIQGLYSTIAMALTVAREQERTNELHPYPDNFIPPATMPRPARGTQAH
jgi:4-carboxymuconolactone decarboxylase